MQGAVKRMVKVQSSAMCYITIGLERIFRIRIVFITKK